MVSSWNPAQSFHSGQCSVNILFLLPFAFMVMAMFVPESHLMYIGRVKWDIETDLLSNYVLNGVQISRAGYTDIWISRDRPDNGCWRDGSSRVETITMNMTRDNLELEYGTGRHTSISRVTSKENYEYSPSEVTWWQGRSCCQNLQSGGIGSPQIKAWKSSFLPKSVRKIIFLKKQK